MPEEDLHAKFAGLQEAFNGQRDLNRREHEWMARDLEDLRGAMAKVMEMRTSFDRLVDGQTELARAQSDQGRRLTAVEPQLERLEEARSAASDLSARRATNWPQFLLAGVGVLGFAFSIWLEFKRPATPDVDTIVAAIEAYEAAHKPPVRSRD